MRIIAWLMCLLLVGGCVRTINPVLLDEQVGEYPQLAGKWVIGEGDDKLHVEIKPDGKQFSVRFADGNGSVAEYSMRVGKVRGLTIAELRPYVRESKSAMQASVLVCPYTFVVITQMEPTLKVKAPKDLGDAQKAGAGENELVIASTAQLQEKIAELWNSEDAWLGETEFVRADEGERK